MTEQLGKMIGNIRLREVLGEGGMGTVYAGFDERLRREVAVKSLRGDRLDATTRLRLLREARLLSQLDHPNICRIYEFVEGDYTDFLVLELIRGKDLRQAMDEKLTPALCLTIAEQVAQTLVAAHAKGVIHRDLKPENIMLTSSDAADPGLVKVLDFGIARSLAGQPAEGHNANDAAPGRTDAGLSAYVQTAHGRVLGTAASMSPEQARGEQTGAASDMYSFGLLLQELFTGRSPYSQELSHDELLARAALGDTLPVTELESELTALIERLKSLAPAARPSAVDVVERLRWIRRRPKRRRRRLMVAAGALALVLAGSKYTVDLRHERNLALTAQDTAEVARAAADEAREEAEQVATFLVDLFAAPDPRHAEGEELTVRQLLERGAEKAEHELADRPLVQARLMTTLGRTLNNLGEFENAREMFEMGLAVRREHLPADHPDLATSLMLLGDLERFLGITERTEKLYLEALAIRERQVNPQPFDVASALQELGAISKKMSKFDQAEAYFQRALAVLDDSVERKDLRIAGTLEELASFYTSTGDFLQADPLYQRLIEMRQDSTTGDRSRPMLALDLFWLAESYATQGRVAAAEPFARRALDLALSIFGSEHPDVSGFFLLLAVVEGERGNFTDAEKHFQRALEGFERTTGSESFNVGIGLGEYGRFSRETAQPKKALAMLEGACRAFEKSSGPDNFILVPHYGYLAVHLADQGRWSEAIELHRRLEEIHVLADPRKPFYLARAVRELGRVYLAAGDLDRAEAAARRALALRAEAVGPKDLQAGRYLNVLAQVQLARGEVVAAAGLYGQALAATRQWLKVDPKENQATAALAASHLGLGEVATKQGNGAQARTHWLEALAILQPLTAAVPKVGYLDLHACTLFRLGQVDAAKAVAKPLMAAGWRRPRFVGLARQHGLLPKT